MMNNPSRCILLAFIACFTYHVGAATVRAGTHPSKLSLKVGYEPCIDYPMPIIPNFFRAGTGYPIGIFWEPFRKHHKTTELEVGLYFCAKNLSGSRIHIDPTTKMNVWEWTTAANYIRFNVTSLTLPLSLKWYPGKKKRFSLYGGLLFSLLLTASKEDPLGELAAAGRPGYEFLKTGEDDPYQTMGVAYKRERDAFIAKWKQRKNKSTAIPVSNVSRYRWGLGFEFGLEYETPIGLILGFPCIRFSTQPGHCSTVFIVGYNFGKFKRNHEKASV